MPDKPPTRLLIYRDSVLPGREETYREIEEDAAGMCARMHCPNPHLAIESLTGPKEVWWLTPFVDEADKQRILDAYASNVALSSALAGITKRKEGVVGPAVEVFTSFRPDLSQGSDWDLARVRFLTVTITNGEVHTAGSVFESTDGARYVFRAAATQAEAEAPPSQAADATIVFAVRPYWGMPAEEWVEADPEFWKVNPSARAK